MLKSSSTYHRYRYREHVPQRNQDRIDGRALQDVPIRQLALFLGGKQVVATCDPPLERRLSRAPLPSPPLALRVQARLFIIREAQLLIIIISIISVPVSISIDPGSLAVGVRRLPLSFPFRSIRWCHKASPCFRSMLPGGDARCGSLLLLLLLLLLLPVGDPCSRV